MKLVETLLSQGLNHSEILRAALKAGEDRKKTCMKLANVADSTLVKQYRTDIWVLTSYLVLLCLVSIGSLVWLGIEASDSLYYFMAGIASLLMIAMVYALSKNRAQAYVAITMLTAMSTLQGLKFVKEAPLAVVVTCLVLNVILIALAVRLKLKLFPHQNFFNTKKGTEGCLAI